MSMKLQKADETTILNDWNVIKHANGYCELYCNIDIHSSEMTFFDYGNNFHMMNIAINKSFPVKFIGNPLVLVNTINIADYNYASPYGIVRDGTKIGIISLLRCGSVEGDFYTPLSIYVQGRWK